MNMGMTITEKLLANASGQPSVKPGDFLWVNVNKLMIHDPCAPGVIGNFYEEFGNDAPIWSSNDLIIIPDHFIYTTDEKSNRNINLMRDFAAKYAVKNFYNPGSEKYQGVCHITLAQDGHFSPGEVFIGTDSHTVTGGAFGAFATGVGNTDASFVMGTGKIFLKVPESFKITFHGIMPRHLSGKDLILKVLEDLTIQGATYNAIEFDGEAIENMSMEERMTICNMVIEAGAKNGVIKADKTTAKYLNAKTQNEFTSLESDKNATYIKHLEYDVNELEPMVAKPHRPDNCVKISTLFGQRITRGYIGSCTGGKTSDFVDAATILHGKKVKVDTYAVPATRQVIDNIINYKIHDKSIYSILKEAGVKLSLEPSCAACCGGPYDTFGRLNKQEICISTTNRNFQGRMGDKTSDIYLASAKTIAASVITGFITDSRNV